MPSSHSSSSHSSSSFSGSSHSSSSHSSSSWGGSGHSYSSLSSSTRNALSRHTVSDSKFNAVRCIPKNTIVGYEHKYRHFTVQWTSKDGNTHIPGYYDENNKRYDGVYTTYDKNVICYCSYCGNTTNFDVSTTTEFECSSCGAPMDVVCVQQERELHEASEANTILRNADTGNKIFMIIVLILFLNPFLGFILMGIISVITGAVEGVVQGVTGRDNTAIVQEYNNSGYSKGKPSTIYLVPTGLDNCYTVSNTPTEDYEIAMRWDGENYYDNTHNYYAWYNDDVSPAMWQYWYDPISENYGNYGWMEYDETTRDWYVEESKGNWIIVPEYYDTSGLYYIILGE